MEKKNRRAEREKMTHLSCSFFFGLELVAFSHLANLM